MSNVNTISSDEDEEFESNLPQNKYTQEQKIVSAVWIHEMQFNGQSYADIGNNFRIRFKIPPPKSRTIVRWERRLFTEGLFSFAKGRSQRPAERLMYVPYVKASFRDKPNITLGERANQLGLTVGTLRRIIKYDLKESDLKPVNEENTYGADVESKEGDNLKSEVDQD